MIPPSGYMRRVILTLLAVTLLLAAGLIFTYDVIKLNWRSNMEIQASVHAQEGPRQWAPVDSVPAGGPSVPKNGKQPTNPVPSDAVSLQRGQLLFQRNCAVCHGLGGKGDGPVVKYFKPDAKKPADLTDPAMAKQSDAAIYLTISQGFGAMPPLNENLDQRARWDVVNYVRTLSK
jgi:mono/diheme cytochrome c family protein